MAISMSAFYPDAQLRESEFSIALTRVAMALAKLKFGKVQKSQPEIEVNFMLSGKYDSPGFKGMRIRRFDSKDNRLVIESAVPERITESNDAEKYIVAALLDAAENAAEFLSEIELTFDLQSHLALIESLAGSERILN